MLGKFNRTICLILGLFLPGSLLVTNAWAELGFETNDINIGMFHFSYDVTSPFGCANTSHEAIRTKNSNGFPTSQLNVLAEDGFDLAQLYAPSHYSTSTNLSESLLDLAAVNNMGLLLNAMSFYRPNQDCNSGVNIYNNSHDSNTRKNDPTFLCKVRMDYENLLQTLSGNSSSKALWGLQVTEEASHTHFVNQWDFPLTWDDSLLCDINIPTQNVSEAISWFKSYTNNRATGKSHMVVMEANHHKSVHAGTVDHSGAPNPQDFLFLLDPDDERDVYFEGSYTQFPPDSWHTQDFAAFKATHRPDNFHYLSKFKNIEFAKKHANSVQSVIAIYQDKDHPGLAYHNHGDQSHQNANWLWFQAYASLIHGAKGIWFWNLRASYWTTDDHTKLSIVEGGELPSRYDRRYFSSIYQNYISNLAREIRFLSDEGVFDPNNKTTTRVWDMSHPKHLVQAKPAIANTYANTDQWANSDILFPQSNEQMYSVQYRISESTNGVYLIAANPMDIPVKLPMLCDQAPLTPSSELEILFQDSFISPDNSTYKLKRNSNINLEDHTVGKTIRIMCGELPIGPLDTIVARVRNKPERPYEVRIKHQKTGNCLFGNTANGGAVKNHECWNDPNMTFILAWLPNSEVQLKHKLTSKCVFGSPINSGIVKNHDCWNDPNMVFVIDYLETGGFRLRHKLTGKCLFGNPVNGGEVKNHDCWNDPNMTFKFEQL